MSAPRVSRVRPAMARGLHRGRCKRNGINKKLLAGPEIARLSGNNGTKAARREIRHDATYCPTCSLEDGTGTGRFYGKKIHLNFAELLFQWLDRLQVHFPMKKIFVIFLLLY